MRTRFRVYRHFSFGERLRMGRNVFAQGSTRHRRVVKEELAKVDTSNGILQTARQHEEAARRLLDMGLVPHWDPPKNWDFLKALALVVAEVPPDAPVLDSGCGRFSVPLEWLEAIGYKDLHAIDFVLDYKGKTGAVDYRVADLTKSPYADGSFAAVLCLSVIEHNVDLEAFFREKKRLLRPGGLLVVSTDYWPEKIETRGVRPYGAELGETRIFDQRELSAALEVAARHGFRPLTPMKFEAGGRVVKWSHVAEKYTFAFVAFRRSA